MTSQKKFSNSKTNHAIFALGGIFRYHIELHNFLSRVPLSSLAYRLSRSQNLTMWTYANCLVNYFTHLWTRPRGVINDGFICGGQDERQFPALVARAQNGDSYPAISVQESQQFPNMGNVALSPILTPLYPPHRTPSSPPAAGWFLSPRRRSRLGGYLNPSFQSEIDAIVEETILDSNGCWLCF